VPQSRPLDRAPETDLHYLSAAQALALFRARKLSPVELMAAVIARAEVVEPTVNAFTHRFFDAAMDAARKAETRYAGRSSRPGRWKASPSRSRRRCRSPASRPARPR
jgi:hypothetical protein